MIRLRPKYGAALEDQHAGEPRQPYRCRSHRGVQESRDAAVRACGRRCGGKAAGLLQQGGCIRYAHTGAPIRRETLRRRVTTVPLPGVERTFTASIKLSIMVKPMPLRSSVPVV